MKTPLLALCLLLGLAGCNPAPEFVDPDPEAAEQINGAEPLPHALPPPSQERYVGLWAAAAEGCSEPAWRFEPQRVTTRGEVACDFTNVRQTGAGYAIEATCWAEGPPQQQEIQLSFAESARAMMVSGGPWAPIALTYCGPIP
jgi:hypothetical protein